MKGTLFYPPTNVNQVSNCTK